jgi:phage I-like protein
MVALHSVALTNKPAIVGMKPIVNRKEVSDAVADPEGVSETAARLDATEPLVGEKTEDCALADGAGRAVEVLRMRLGLPTDSDVETVLTAAEDRLASLTQESAEREASGKVAAAFKAGKLTGAQRDWALSLALRDPAGFDAWAASAPQVVLLGQTEAPATSTCGRTGRDREAIVASARAAFRSEPSLTLLTSESAWVCEALREAGFEADPDDEQRGIETGVNGTHGMKRAKVS